MLVSLAGDFHHCCCCQDPVTKNNSGTAWLLFCDEASVDRAMTLYNRGEVGDHDLVQQGGGR